MILLNIFDIHFIYLLCFRADFEKKILSIDNVVRNNVGNTT